MAVEVDPRYLSYDKDDVERILDSVAEFDDIPTAGSGKPVKSGGVATALEGKLESEENNDPMSLFDDSSDGSDSE